MSKDLYKNVFPSIYKASIYKGYPELLNGIYTANGLKTDIRRQNYLRQLQGPAKELWNSYRTGDRHFTVDYSDRQCPEVYLLRYFFPHALLLPYVVDALRNSGYLSLNSPNNGDFRIVLFGSGPCPEPYGLLCYLEKTQTNISNISASLFDIEYEERSIISLANYSEIRKFQPTGNGWDYGRDIVLNHLLRPFSETNAYVGVDVEDRTIVIPDLTTTERKPSLSEISTVPSDLKGEKQNFLPDDAANLLNDSDLIVIQNSLNEIDPSYHSQLEMNILNIVKDMKSGAMMVIIERSSKEGYGDAYKKTNELLRTLKSRLRSNFNNVNLFPNHAEQDWPDKPVEISVGPLNNEYLPSELNEFLFIDEDGLRLARKITFHFLIVLKNS